MASATVTASGRPPPPCKAQGWGDATTIGPLAAAPKRVGGGIRRTRRKKGRPGACPATCRRRAHKQVGPAGKQQAVVVGEGDDGRCCGGLFLQPEGGAGRLGVKAPALFDPLCSGCHAPAGPGRPAAAAAAAGTRAARPTGRGACAAAARRSGWLSAHACPPGGGGVHIARRAAGYSSMHHRAALAARPPPSRSAPGSPSAAAPARRAARCAR